MKRRLRSTAPWYAPNTTAPSILARAQPPRPSTHPSSDPATQQWCATPATSSSPTTAPASANCSTSKPTRRVPQPLARPGRQRRAPRPAPANPRRPRPLHRPQPSPNRQLLTAVPAGAARVVTSPSAPTNPSSQAGRADNANPAPQKSTLPVSLSMKLTWEFDTRARVPTTKMTRPNRWQDRRDQSYTPLSLTSPLDARHSTRPNRDLGNCPWL